MNANQAMAPVRETILARLTGAITDVAARTAAQATLMALSNTVSNLPTLMPGGSTRKRNKKHKKTTRKNKKVTKKQKKRRKQNKKTKRK
jgi:DNA-binding SARP family transcriptional activator